MKFVVSDIIPGDRKFGKWHYSHDNDVQTWTDGERLCLWFGYTIDKQIEEYISNDTDDLVDANGNFCVIVLGKDHLKVCLDYFGQTKIYYNTQNGLSVSNQLSLLALTRADVNKESVDGFMEGLGDDVPLYACKDPMNMQYLLEWNKWSHDNTLFRQTFSVPLDHWLTHTGGVTEIKKIYNLREQNLKSFKNQKRMSNNELEDTIHECMLTHSDIIKNQYKNIVSSISEGIDSTLQDQYFENGTRIMYHPKEPNTEKEIPPKNDIIKQYNSKGKNVRFDVFDVNSIGAIVDQYLIDPMLSWMDTVPTIWQVNSQKQKPDVLLYGTCADEMFMHVPKFLFARIPPPHRYRYQETYGGRKSPARASEDPYNGHMLQNWQEEFATMAEPNRYGRDIQSQTDVLTTSLYADRRIFNLVHKLSFDQQLDSMANVGIQKRILQDKFNFDFQTKYKDGAGYECRMVLKHLLTTVLDKVVDSKPNQC